MRDIGVDVKPPVGTCDDPNCPFHGHLKVRGQVIMGTVRLKKMDKTVVVDREYIHYLDKYQRYEKRTSRYHAHLPPCIDLNVGDKVKIMECKPLNKTVSFVVVENMGDGV